MRAFFGVVLVLAMVAIVAARAPLYNTHLETLIPDQYVVVLQRNATEEIRDRHIQEVVNRSNSSQIINVFAIGDMIGYSAVLDKDTLANVIDSPLVRYIDVDHVFSLSLDEKVIQTGSTWGLDRITQQSLPLSNSYEYFASAGGGVTAYVLDSGIYLSHSEFGGRATFGYSSIAEENNDDGNGHGTHVAGTIGGKTYGVAKLVSLVAVKVLNAGGGGTLAGIVAGIDWVTSNHKSRGTKARSVANMSLGGPATQALDDAVTASITAGVNYALAAGNNGQSSCNYSPARAPAAITVGATTNTDARASFSNFGTCNDIFAPGNSITSAWIGGTTATSAISGTSMAAPHVAGAIALRLGHLLADTPDAAIPTPAVIATWLTTSSTSGKITSVGTGSPNRLLFSPFQ